MTGIEWRPGVGPPRAVGRRLSEAVVELASRVDGPVFDPHGVEALVELAGSPRDGLCRRLAVVGATGAADVATVLRWAEEHVVAVAVPGGALLGDPVRPTVVISLSRVDRIVPDPVAWRLRVGVGASWAGVAGRIGLPPGTGRRSALAGRVADTLARLPVGALPRLRSVTLVGLDATIREVTAAHRPELWAALRSPARAADLLGVVTDVELDLAGAPGRDRAQRPTA